MKISVTIDMSDERMGNPIYHVIDLDSHLIDSKNVI